MKSAVTLIFLLLGAPAWAEIPRARDGFQLEIAASVISAALAFIAPRALDAVTVQQLAIWGLSAPASIDSALSTELRDGAVVLLQNNRLIYARPAPTDDNPAAWGKLAADVLNVAAQTSIATRTAGTQAAIVAFFDELFNHLDPYSRYVVPAAADADRARRSGEAGAGIQIRPSGAGFVVSGINAGGTGAEAGIRLGDRLIAVDGQPVAGEDLETIQAWIGGVEGTELKLTIRTRNGPARTLDLERSVTPPETVFATRMNAILLIRIASFSRDTDERLRQELDRNLNGAQGKPIRGLVLDLRGNRGGLLRQAVAATNLILDHGIVAVTAGRSPLAAHRWGAEGQDLTKGRPVIVLVDGRSASAAEIMAAALADQGRAVVVGSATLGKGLVQTIANLPDGAELFVSWSRVLAPAGWPIQGLGVLPQICTSLGQDALTQQLNELERGSQPMETALLRHRAARAPIPTPEILALRTPCPASEARDSDLAAARFLLAHPTAYTAALLSPPP